MGAHPPSRLRTFTASFPLFRWPHAISTSHHFLRLRTTRAWCEVARNGAKSWLGAVGVVVGAGGVACGDTVRSDQTGAEWLDQTGAEWLDQTGAEWPTKLVRSGTVEVGPG